MVEAPFYIGEEPCKPLDAKYVGTWHLPPLWIKRMGEAAGFTLKSIKLGPYLPQQRLVYRLERVHDA